MQCLGRPGSCTTNPFLALVLRLRIVQIHPTLVTSYDLLQNSGISCYHFGALGRGFNSLQPLFIRKYLGNKLCGNLGETKISPQNVVNTSCTHAYLRRNGSDGEAMVHCEERFDLVDCGWVSGRPRAPRTWSIQAGGIGVIVESVYPAANNLLAKCV